MFRIMCGSAMLVLAALAAGCGGGGGGGGAAAPVAVQLSETNAKPVGAHATGTAQDASASQGSAGLLTGVQVDGGEPPMNLGAMAGLAGLAGQSAGGLPMAAGVTVGPSTRACPLGGSLTLSGTVASSSGLSGGDVLDLSASNCAMTVDGVATTMNGGLGLRMVSGFLPGSGLAPFQVVLVLSAQNLSVRTATRTSSSNGDLQLNWNQTSASNGTLTASGAALTSSLTTASGSRNTTLRNYVQSKTINGSAVSATLSATVESTSSLLGSPGATYRYTVGTPTALQWTTASALPTAGVVQVVGAGNSQLLVTYSASGVVISIDANGDGVFEKTVTTTAAELRGML